MSWLKDIQKQPRHVREILFGLSAITTLSLIGIVWVNSFKKELVALMHPEPAQQNTGLAEGEKAPSLFSSIFKSVGDLKAGILSSVGGEAEESPVSSPTPKPKPKLLPISSVKTPEPRGVK